MASRLKVFQYSDGFHTWTVAASSRPKALAAWGVERDLFKDGSAIQIDTGADHDAALARPGDLIERAIPIKVAGKTPSKATRKRQAAAGKRRELESDLAALETEQARERAPLEKARKQLQARIDRMEARHQKARSALRRRIDALDQA